MCKEKVPPKRMETPTQVVINGQESDNKKLCIAIVGLIRKIKQDLDVTKKRMPSLLIKKEF